MASNSQESNKRLIEIEKNFQVYVGIDFGTDGTGLAYALPTGEVFVHQKWKGYKRSVEVKPKTRILLDAGGNFLAFGQPATNSYITMGGEKTGWMLFERFKMALYGMHTVICIYSIIILAHIMYDLYYIILIILYYNR